MIKIITIDGPSASGKGTVAKKVAEQLHYAYLDSGALYRLVAYKTLQNQIDYENLNSSSDEIANLALTLSVEFNGDDILLDKQNVSAEIRQEKVGLVASKISQIVKVRENLLTYQQEFGIKSGKQGLIADGRDMGSVVFPNADLKIFLTASAEIRAKRRFLQLNQQVDYQQILQDIEKRDFQDQNRAIAPLKCYDDMKLLDTSDLNINQAVDLILNWFK